MCGPNWRKQNLLRGRLHFIDRGIRGIGGIGTGGTFSVIDFRSREFFSSAFTSPSVNPPIRHQQIHHRLTSPSHGFPAFRRAKVQGYIFVRAFGNITKSGSPFTFTPSYSSATNRMTPIGSFTPTHDNNGNVLNDNSHAYTWNAGGQALTIDSVNLTYDALGRMVEQNRSGAYTQFVYAPTGQKMQIMNGQASVKSIVPLPGGGQAVFTASGQYYYHSDHLGSFRFASTSNRTMYFDQAYAPFGETYAASGATDPAFTTQRQDTVTGLYDFPAREYSIQGRWPSPDPAGLAAVDPTNPQSWNRYAYVGNDPADFVDPLGTVRLPPGFGGGGGGCDPLFDPFCGGGGIGPCDELGILLCGPPGSGLPCAEDNPNCGITVPLGVGVGFGGGSPTSNPRPVTPRQIQLAQGPTGLPGTQGFIGVDTLGELALCAAEPELCVAIRVTVWGIAIIKAAQAAYQLYRSRIQPRAIPREGTRTDPKPKNHRVKKCTIHAVGPGYCTYICDDGTTTVDPSCAPVIYPPAGEPW